MKKLCLFLLLIFCYSFFVGAQTQSDSLYNTKLHALENGDFLLIGTEKPGTYRKTIIRLYDQNLKVKKQIRLKNGRNYEVYLDEILPFGFRIIDRYRWSKGRVYLFNKDLEITSNTFFKRDEHKDWTIKTDEYNGYPLRGDEHLFGLDPVFHADSLCYYFDKATNKILVYKYDYRNIKPVFLPVTEVQLNIEPGIPIETYKFGQIEQHKVIFNWAADERSDLQLNFCLIDLSDLDTVKTKVAFLKDTKIRFFVSDFGFNAGKNQLVVSGGYVDKASGKPWNGSKGMDGYFYMNHPGFTEKENKFLKQLVPNSKEDSSGIIGYKTVCVESGAEEMNVLFEKFSVSAVSVTADDKSDLRGSYYKIYPQKMISTQLSAVSGEQSDFIKFNFFSEQFKGNDYRILNNLKAQTLPQIMFNGNADNSKFKSSIVHADYNSDRIIYSDRNENYFMYEIETENNTVLVKNTEKAKCYFFDGYFIKFYTTDWGFKLEKIAY